ncbi:ATP-binding cassette domain-containing protein [Streptomyces griseoincarnatus]
MTPVKTALLSANRVRDALPGRHGAPDARGVDGVDLGIRRNEIVALVGASGCGRTTLTRTLLGLVAPTGSGVVFDGRPLEYSGRSLKAYRKRAHLALQDPSGSLNPRHTMYDAPAHRVRRGGRRAAHQRPPR